MAEILPRRGAPPSQQERILDAARSLFASRGFENVTMAEIASLAGVARATVFNHFGSKGALVEAITEGVLSFYALLLDSALADKRTSTATLVRALFDTMGFGIEQFHGFYRGVFREIMKLQVGLSEGGAAARAREQALAKLERLVARGQERGDLSREFAAGDLAVAIDSLANGTINHWLYEDTSGSLRERMRRAADVLLGPVAREHPSTQQEALPDLLLPLAAQPMMAPVAIAVQRARNRRRQ
jgi:AcrR family transcriptional regulator